MRKILLVCSAGMSTSMLVKKILSAAEKEHYEIQVEARSISEARGIGSLWDVILLGPQVKFQLKEIKNAFPDKPVEAIDMKSYGRMDGEVIVKQIRFLLKD